VNTFLASAGGCIASLIAKFIVTQSQDGHAYFDLLAGMNGSLSGLVSITAGCATLNPRASLVTGAIAGLLYLWGSITLVRFRLDDVVDAIPVHFISGAWGLISVGLLSDPERMLKAYGNDFHPVFFSIH
jgi:Amt family ammonium transporter